MPTRIKMPDGVLNLMSDGVLNGEPHIYNNAAVWRRTARAIEIDAAGKRIGEIWPLHVPVSAQIIEAIEEGDGLAALMSLWAFEDNTVRLMFTLKDENGNPDVASYALVEFDDDNGVYYFERISPNYFATPDGQMEKADMMEYLVPTYAHQFLYQWRVTVDVDDEALANRPEQA